MTVELVAALIREQFPALAGLPLEPVATPGVDNATFRLGDALSVRLPRGEMYAAQVGKEQAWLPVLGPQLPVLVPQPVARGRPGCGYPWPWSIYRWIDGAPVSAARVTDLVAFAAELSTFLVALQGLDAAPGPRAGPHSFFRAGAVGTYDGEVREAVDRLGPQVDGQAVMRVWDAALASVWPGPPVWVHGDLAPTNLLCVDGHLAAVIDWGCCAVGDPACDLVIAWTLFSGRSRDAFVASLALDEATWARARGWAIWKALITLSNAATPADVDAAVRRFGWRAGAREIIADLSTSR